MRLNQFPDKKKFLDLARTCNVIPVCREILADTETPVSLLKKFHEVKAKDGSPLFLLESVEGGEKWGRYSFLGTSAMSDVYVFQDHVRIRKNDSDEKIRHDNDPLKVLKDLMSDYKPAHIKGLPRFWGGLVGYITYEMVSFFEKIPSALAPDSPIAHFIIPDELLIIDNIRNTLIIISIAFVDDPENAALLYEKALKKIDAVQDIMNTSISNGNGVDEKGPSISARIPKEDYCNRVVKVKNHIRKGDVIQTVISQPFTCKAPDDVISLYRAQRYVNPSPYLFFFNFQERTLVGSSPETMVRLENRIATLRPIAGTRKRGKNEQEDRALADELLADEKERAEHLMLVDLGRNDLGRIARTGTVQVTDLMFVERYSHVMHLVSNITCDVKTDCDAWDLLRATFPAGTLSGAPKVRAMEIIADLEQGPRGPYGGAVGYISFSGNMDLAITIRTACIENGVLAVRSGAGIVADSDPEKEHMETINKAMAIEKALELTRTE